MNVKNNFFSALILLSILFSLCACQGREKHNQTIVQKKSPDEMKESLIDANKKRMLEEMDRINDYVERHNYKMTTTATGIRMMILSEGKGQKPELLSDVSVKYRINSLDGSYIYSSDSSGVLSFILGQSDEPSGLQEALLNLNEGTKALIIVPYYLAYGITGDGDKIGGAESLVYNIELTKVRSN